MQGILSPASAHTAVMVRDDSIAMHPIIPTLHHFFWVACAWPQAGVGFCGGRDRLTCYRGQLILKGVGFIAEHEILFLHSCYSVSEGGVIGNDVPHVVGEEQIGDTIISSSCGNVIYVPFNRIHHLMVRFGIGCRLPETHFPFCHYQASKL